jgi:hypothetical protein
LGSLMSPPTRSGAGGGGGGGGGATASYYSASPSAGSPPKAVTYLYCSLAVMAAELGKLQEARAWFQEGTRCADCSVCVCVCVCLLVCCP